jgi:hypothetical protein
MKFKITKSILLSLIMFTLSGICLSLIAQNGGAVKLEYKYPSDKAIKYLAKNTMAQIMDVQGQTMQTDVTSAFGCTVKSTGTSDNNLMLEITIDTLGQTTSSPMGYAGGSMESVTGKSMNILISPNGKPVDITAAESMIFVVEGSGESNMGQSVIDFFHLLPDKAVKPGDTWEITDSVSTSTPVMKMKTIDSSVNKLEGFETVDGLECAKISSTHEGTWSMNVQSQGYDIYINGPYTGTSECLFAVKEGYFIKNTSSTKMVGDLDLASMGMVMPITIIMDSVNEIVK